MKDFNYLKVGVIASYIFLLVILNAKNPEIFTVFNCIIAGVFGYGWFDTVLK